MARRSHSDARAGDASKMSVMAIRAILNNATQRSSRKPSVGVAGARGARSLGAAEIKVGTVEAMCPLKERGDRIPDDLHILEKEHPDVTKRVAGDNGSREPWHSQELILKRYQRPAAGLDVSLPELLRTPKWLCITVDHIIQYCMDNGRHGGRRWADPRVNEYLAERRASNATTAEDETDNILYTFVWDRLRMVRGEFVMQGYNGVVGLMSEAAISAHERIARWYVLMNNRMAKNTLHTHRFNVKSIVETLKTLSDFYSLRVSRGKVVDGLASPNEPEMMSLYILTVMGEDQGMEVQRLVKEWSKGKREVLRRSREIEGALRMVEAWESNDYVAFFSCLREQGRLQRCIILQYVGYIRAIAMTHIAKSYSEVSVAELTRVLCFADKHEVFPFLEAYQISPNESGQVILRARDPASRRFRLTFVRPERDPVTPMPQHLVEREPWDLASAVVLAGDHEPLVNKSHDVGMLSAPTIPAKIGTPLSRAERGPNAVTSVTLSPLSSFGGLKAGDFQMHPPDPFSTSGIFAPSKPTDGAKQAAPSATAFSSRGKQTVFGKDKEVSGSQGFDSFSGSGFANNSKFGSWEAGSPFNVASQWTFEPSDKAFATGDKAREASGEGSSFSPAVFSGRAQTFASVEADRRAEEDRVAKEQEAVRRAQAQQAALEEERRRNAEAEAVRLATEEAKRRAAEAERIAKEKEQAKQRADAERRAREDAIKRRVEAERRAVTEKAIDNAVMLLSRGKLVPIATANQLPPSTKVFYDVMEMRRKRISSFGHAFAKIMDSSARRRQREVWAMWLNEVRRDAIDKEQMLRKDLLMAENMARVAEGASVLRRRKRWTDDGQVISTKGSGRRIRARSGDLVARPGSVHVMRSTLETVAAKMALYEKTARAKSHKWVLRRPHSLELPAVLAANLRKSQRVGAAECYWKAGVADSDVRDCDVDMPHLFWKAVLIVPWWTRGDIGGWLEAKLGGRTLSYAEDINKGNLFPIRVTCADGMDTGEMIYWAGNMTSRISHLALNKFTPEREPGAASWRQPCTWLHSCVQRVDIDGGSRLVIPAELSATMDTASVIVYGAIPRNHDEFFTSPLTEKPDWSEAREDFEKLCNHLLPPDQRNPWDPESSGAPPILVIVPFGACASGFGNVETHIVNTASMGLGIEQLVESGLRVQVIAVGMHKFASRSSERAAMSEGLVAQGAMEEDSSRQLAQGLSDLAAFAPRQPLMATRALAEMLKSAVSRSVAMGPEMSQPLDWHPSLGAVVNAVTEAKHQIRELLDRKTNACWPIPQFQITMENLMEDTRYVLGASRPRRRELMISSLRDTGSEVDGSARVSRAIEKVAGGLPLDWTTPSDAHSTRIARHLEAATFPQLPSRIAAAFGPDALAGGPTAKPLGQKVAREYAETLDVYLGRGVISYDLRRRLEESIEKGVMMRGAPPDWRSLVREGVSRRVVSAAGGLGAVPLVVHFAVTSGPDRVGNAVSDVLGATTYCPPSTAANRESPVRDIRQEPWKSEAAMAETLAVLKRAASRIFGQEAIKGGDDGWVDPVKELIGTPNNI